MGILHSNTEVNEDACPSLPIRSEYGKYHEEALVKAHNWIRKNCVAVAWLPENLFDWARKTEPEYYENHVRLQAGLDDLIEKRAPIEQFQKTLAEWGTLYCRLARKAHVAMIVMLDDELRVDLKREAQAREEAA